ncbi:MAG: hypothetical protein IJ430_11050 [Parabacteroides sp.]|nr:hypothetical protein [Parabacteroides sp.]
MEDYTFDLGSTKFDKQFEKVEGLSWLPWVGHDYVKSERRILIVAESHYVKDGSKDIGRQKKEVVGNKLETRQCVVEYPLCNDWRSRMYDYLHRVLFGTANLHESDREKLWNNLAFYNFVQNPMDYRGELWEKERPEWNAFYDGWRIFVEIVKIIKPTECLFVGVTASNSFNLYMKEHDIEYSNVEYMDVPDVNTYGRKHSITMDGNVIPIIGIQHTSHHFKYDKWHDFLNENTPMMMGHLNSLVDFPEKTIRHNVLTILKKEGFRYYYVINEKDIEFDEDDKSGWVKIWVTLGRQRDDKQLDSVTIGCYGDGILLVETGVRKNPNINVVDTENKSWWTKYDAKDFNVNGITEKDILNWLRENKVFKEIFQ